MFAATVGGVYNKVEDAMEAMAQGYDASYTPNPERVAFYNRKYQKYLNLAYNK